MRAVVFDLDGTLLNREHRICEANHKMIDSLRKNQLKVFLASGRTSHSMRPFYDQLDLETPMISFNGAVVTYPDGTMTHTGLSQRVVRILIDFSRREQLHLNLYDQEYWYTERPNSDEAVQYGKIAGLTPVALPFDQLMEKPITKALLISSPPRLDEVKPMLTQLFGPDASLTSSLPHFLEILNPQVNKGNALTEVMRREEIPLDQVIAFGDGLNDLEMLQTVGWGVAMENARPQLKSVAQAVAPHHGDSGVARYLESYLSC